MNARIYKLMRGVDVWVWLCTKHLARRKANGWDVLEQKDPPTAEGLPCDECAS